MKIIEASELSSDEKVYLKKDFLGWRVVEPIKNPETGEWIWKNIFNLRGFIMLIFILLLLGVGYLGFKEQINNYKEVMSNPCPYCKDCQSLVLNAINNNTWSNKNIVPINFTLVT